MDAFYQMNVTLDCQSRMACQFSKTQVNSGKQSNSTNKMNNSNADFSPQKNEPETAAPHSGESLTPQLSLEDRVRLTFDQLGYPQLNSIRCIAEGDQMRLTGELHSFYLKQVAQSVVVKIPGVRTVRNEIEVR
jgi:osmotically-inducible protein OsmY